MTSAAKAYRGRDLASTLVRALEDMPVVVVTGMRQTGKTTLLRNERGLRERRYVTLDDFAQLEAARTSPETFLGRNEPLTIDEAQRAPELLVAIKRAVDRDRVPGRFLLSGSAAFGLLAGTSESLAGRAVAFRLHPLSQRELAGSIDGEPFVRRFFDAPDEAARDARAPVIDDREILRGGFAPVALGDVRNAELWFRGYEQTYLERDVRELAHVGDLGAFRTLLRLTALRTAQVLNASELARDAKLNATTARRWLDLLDASFVTVRLPPFLRNRASRLIKSPKLHVGDSGLAAWLAGVDDISAGADEPMRGALYETWTAQQLGAALDARWPRARLAYWHVQGRHEVDFVIEAGRDTLAIEVKAATRWTDRDLAGLRAFLAAVPRCRAGILAYRGDAIVPLGERLWAVPLETLVS